MDRCEKNIYCEDPILCRIFTEFVDYNMEAFKQWLSSNPEVNYIYNKQLKNFTCEIEKQRSKGG